MTHEMHPTSSLLNRDELFFFANAAWGYNPKRETPAQGRTNGAIRLAAAEAAFWDAQAYASVEFKIAPDLEATQDDGEPRWSMWIEDGAGHVLSSLGGIDDDGVVYRRVVMAELALDVIDELRALTAAEMAGD